MWPEGAKISKVHVESTDIHDFCVLWFNTLYRSVERGRERAERKACGKEGACIYTEVGGVG